MACVFSDHTATLEMSGLREQRPAYLLKVRAQIGRATFKLRSRDSHFLRPQHLLKVHTFTSGVKSEGGGSFDILVNGK